MTAKLADRIAIVTGAAGDIGAAIGAAFVAEGARVALLDRDGEALQATVARRFAQTAQTADAVLPLVCDVTDERGVRAAYAAVHARWGHANVLVNNAATLTATVAIGAMDEAEWQQALDVNLTGAWRMSRHAIAAMKAAGGGVVLTIASQLGHVARPGRGAYSVTKAGLHALTRAIAVDHAADGIRAVSLSPGAVLTSRLVQRYGSADAVRAALVGDYPAGRLGTPEEVARAAAYLASADAAFATGSDMLLDGGYTAV